MLLDFYVKTGTKFSLRDERLFKISEVEITSVNCTGGMMTGSVLSCYTEHEEGTFNQ